MMVKRNSRQKNDCLKKDFSPFFTWPFTDFALDLSLNFKKPCLCQRFLVCKHRCISGCHFSPPEKWRKEGGEKWRQEISLRSQAQRLPLVNMFLQLNSGVKSLSEIMFLQDHQYFRGWVFPVSVCGLLICRVLLPTCWPSMTPSKIAISLNFIPSWSHSLSIKMMNLWKFFYFCCFCTKKPKGKCCYMFISFSVVKSKSYCVTGG